MKGGEGKVKLAEVINESKPSEPPVNAEGKHQSSRNNLMASVLSLANAIVPFVFGYHANQT